MNAPGKVSAEKLDRLRASLREAHSVLVAFSAGVDSTFLLRVAHEELGERCLAATFSAPFIPRRELDEATAFCRNLGIGHVVLDAALGDIPHFEENPPDRCYHCKRALFSRLTALARERGIDVVVEGSNIDDDGDYRPGRRAISELGIRSPLRDAGLSKAEIRALSGEMLLPTASKPSSACLASRVPYGERISAETLGRVERAEQWLRDSGFAHGQLRVRAHGKLARIEVPQSEIPRLAGHAGEIAAALEKIGFSYVSLDLRGYRTGSLNETLP